MKRMEDIKIDTLRICQESVDFNNRYKQFYIINDDSNYCHTGIFLMKNQKHGRHDNDDVWYKAIEEAIETAMIFVKNKYQTICKYRITIEISSDKEMTLPNYWNWRDMTGFNGPNDKVEVISCEKLS